MSFAALVVFTVLAAPVAQSQVQGEFVPPALLRDSPAAYPRELAASGIAGEVTLQLRIDELGTVAEVKLARSTDPRFEATALRAAQDLRFEPATLDGVAVQAWIEFSYRFEAPKPVLPQRMPSATVRGQVRARGNRRPVPSAAIRVEGLEKVVRSAPDGTFLLELHPGRHVLRVSAPAFHERTFAEEVKDGEALDVIYALTPRRIDPYETIVRGERERTEVSRVTLEEAEIRDVPGTMGDPFRVVMLLPGVSTMASGLAYPIVRGTQPAATGYHLDRIRVPILFHLFLGPAVVHPDFIDAIDFFPGAPPPEYGRLLGGAIDGKVSRARDDRLHASVYADMINSGGFVEYPFQSTGTNVTLAGRVSYAGWLLSTGSNLFAPSSIGKTVLEFYDYQGRIEQKIGDSGRLRLLAFGSSDVFGVVEGPSGERTLQSIVFHRADLRYGQRLGRGEWEAGITFGFDEMESQGGTELSPQDLGVSQLGLTGYGRFSLELGRAATLVLGADVDHKRALVTVEGAIARGLGGVRVDEPVALATFSGAWMQLVWKPASGLSVIPGLRVDNYHLVPGVDFRAVEPRLTARYAFNDDVALKGGLGLYHQAPSFLISAPVVDVAGLQLGLQEAWQFDVGAEWKLPVAASHALELSADVYFNPLVRTLELNPFDTPAFDDSQLNQLEKGASSGIPRLPDFAARGHAYGIELLLRHPLGNNWFGWLSYTFQRSVRYQRVVRTDALGRPLGFQESWVDFAFDQTHVANLVVSHRFEGGWTVGGAVHFNTGRPELGQKRLGPEATWIPVDRDQLARLPSFVRVDGRVSKSFAFDDFTLEGYLDVMNLSVSSEVFGYQYSDPDEENPEPSRAAVSFPIIVPALGLKARY